MMGNKFWGIALGLLFVADIWAGDVKSDPFLWLEEVESAEALQWVREQNEATLAEFQKHPEFEKIRAELRTIYTAKDRIPAVGFRGDILFNFWTDGDHQQGLWRQTTLEEYKKPDPAWDVIIDLDELSKKEGIMWVWKGASCFPPEYKKCLISLSPGGKDATVVREFDLETREFVEGGFKLPESKGRVSWIDENTLFISRNFGEGTLTKSGYPRQVKIWKRGTPLESAELVFEGKESDVSASGFSDIEPERTLLFLNRGIDFYHSEVFLFDPKTKSKTKIEMPADASFEGVFKDYLLYGLKSDWNYKGVQYQKGDLVSFPLKSLSTPELKLVYRPGERETLESVTITKKKIYISIFKNVSGQLLKGDFKGDGTFEFSRVNLPDFGSVGVSSVDDEGDQVIVSFSSFLVPASTYVSDNADLKELKLLKSGVHRFNSEGFSTDQFEATSKDGTKIPYFVVRNKNMKLDGNNPTLLYGYGGFEISLTPSYLGATGKTWLERGGVYVLANIRGGGEFGPSWHQAALKHNRQRAYDDFAAVAEDLIQRKITAPQHLAVQGGSNGGLLTGVMLTQRPELFNGTIIQVPLLDMVRFHKLLAGNSWVGEYGDPDNPEDLAHILKYSPYQNIKDGASYPVPLITTSTKDDRVHPGHARKMAAKLQSLGYQVYYYENTDGGHGGAANPEQSVLVDTLECAYLLMRLKK